MNEEDKVRFGIKINDAGKNRWSVGLCLSHWGKETYIIINLVKWSISIGFLYID